MEKMRGNHSSIRQIIASIALSVGIYFLLLALEAVLVVNGFVKGQSESVLLTAALGLLAAWLGGGVGNYLAHNKDTYTGLFSSIGMVLLLAVLGMAIWGEAELTGESAVIAVGMIAGGFISTFVKGKKRKKGKRIRK